MNARHVATITRPANRPLFDVRLAGVAVDPDDRVYVLGDNVVRRFDANLEVEHEFSLDALGWSLLAEKDTIWVGLDGGVKQYSPAGEVLSEIHDPARIGRVTAIAAAGDWVVLADATNRAVHRYSRTGEYGDQIGDHVNTRGFMLPNGVLDLVGDPQTQSVLVAHSQKHRVEQYRADGKLLAKWGRFGMQDPADFGGCCNPTNIAASKSGIIAVSEKAPPRIKLYNSEGIFKQVLDQSVFDPNTKNIDLVFDSRLRLYATDPLRKVVEVFQVDLDEGTP